MKKIILIVILLTSFLLAERSEAQLTGTSLPATCSAGQTFTYTAVTPSIDAICASPNTWVILSLRAGPYVMPDNSFVDLFQVALPTSNTGCTIHTTYTYSVFNGSNAAEHGGFIVWAIVNNNGVVTSNNTDVGETFVGTGCGGGCDVWSSTTSGTTLIGRARFNNTLSVNGSLRYRILSSSCPSVIPF